MYLWTATGSPQTNDSERGITMKKIGAITVGQSPRVDLIPEIQPILGDSVEIIQTGALDGLSKEEIAKFVPRPGENVLVSRLTDGTSATFPRFAFVYKIAPTGDFSTRHLDGDCAPHTLTSCKIT